MFQILTFASASVCLLTTTSALVSTAEVVCRYMLRNDRDFRVNQGVIESTNRKIDTLANLKVMKSTNRKTVTKANLGVVDTQEAGRVDELLKVL